MIRVIQICDTCKRRFDTAVMRSGVVEGEFCSTECVQRGQERIRAPRCAEPVSFVAESGFTRYAACNTAIPCSTHPAGTLRQ